MCAGSKVPQDTIFDITTRSQRKGFDKRNQLPRLWVRQIRHLVLADHTEGTFDHVDIKNVDEELQTWENENEAILLRLAAVLHQLLDVVKKAGTSHLRGHREGYGWLEIIRPDEAPKGTLPDDLRALWGKRTKDIDSRECTGTGGDDDESLCEEEEIDDLDDILLNR